MAQHANLRHLQLEFVIVLEVLPRGLGTGAPDAGGRARHDHGTPAEGRSLREEGNDVGDLTA
jgi:hypothetical protein